MGWFWFLVSIGLLIALISRRQSTTEDSYAQGYWDGYRAFGAKLQERMVAKRTNSAALQELIDEGQGANTAEPLTPEDVFMEDTYGSAQAGTADTASRIDWS